MNITLYNEAANHILNDDYRTAIEKLEPLKNEEKASYWLSLLYRSQWDFQPELAKFGYEEYLKEKELIENIIFENEYFMQRKIWHALPYHERSEPRPCKNEDPDPSYTLNSEILENMTFVSFSCNKFFDKLVELIESVQCIKTYTHIPWNIVEPWGAELTDEQKHLLVTKYNIKNFAKPDFQNWFPNSEINLYKESPGFQAYITYTFVKALFPGYKYFFNMQADVWINNRCAIDYTITLGAKYDAFFIYADSIITFSKERSEFFNTISEFIRNSMENSWDIANTEWSTEFLKQYPSFLTDPRPPYFFGNFWQFVANRFAIEKKSPPVFQNELKNGNHIANSERCIPIFENNDIYYYENGKSGRFCAYQLSSYRDLQYIRIIKKENLDLNKHAQHAYNLIFGIQPPEEENYNIWYPIRYRVLPWKEIPEIKKILKKEALSLESKK